MRFLRHTVLALVSAALSCLAPLAASAQTNYTTNVTLNNLLSTGGAVTSAKVCASAVDQYGNPLAFSSPTWGLVEPGAQFCGTASGGAIAGGFNVPDACHTNQPSPIFYNVTIQPLASGVPTGGMIQLNRAPIPSVCGTSYPLDSYTPSTTVISPQSQIVTTGNSVPSSCTSPSLFLITVGGVTTGYVCSNGVPTAFAQAGGTGIPTSPTDCTLPNVSLGINGSGNSVCAALTPAAIGALSAPTLGGLPVVINLPFNDQTGTVAHDISGNGYNATFQSGGRAPSFLLKGVAITPGTGLDLPAAVNGVGTWCFAFNIPPLPATSNYLGNFYGLLYSNIGNGQPGLNLLTQYAGSQVGAFYTDIVAPTIFTSGGYPTSGNVPFAGTQRLCYALGSSPTLDVIYQNGVALDSYRTQGSSAGLQTSSYLSIGGNSTSTWASAGIPQTIYHAVGFSGQLSASQVQQVDQYLQSDLNQSGVPLVPQLNVLTNAQLIFCCDSISASYAVTGTPWTTQVPALLTNQPTYNPRVISISGLTALAVAGSEPYRIGQLCNTTQGSSVVSFFEGTNDATFFSGASPQIVFGNIASSLTKLNSAGCKTLVGTMISRTGNTPWSGTPTIESQRPTINGLIRSQGKINGAFGIVDFAANPALGATGANSNTSCFAVPDGIHPTGATCQTYLAQTLANSMNYYTGSTAGNPTILTTATTLLSGYRYVDFTGCTSSCSLTLPDGTGPTGECYTIVTGSVASTVIGQTLYGYQQLVNNSSSAQTLVANRANRLCIQALPQTTSGVEWFLQ